jgi:hypothetical protein
VGEDPLYFYVRLFVRFLQGLFGTFEKGAYHWSLDESATDITITDQGTVNKEVIEKRPAIVVSLGPMAMNNIAIDQFAGPITNWKDSSKPPLYDPSWNPHTGTKRHTDLISSTMTVNCLSREGVEARRIAWIVGYFTRALKRVLMRSGLHRVGEEVQFGAESAPGSIVQPDSNEIVMVSVSLPFYAQNTWSVAPVDKTLLKHVETALRSEAGEQKAPARIREPGIYGRTIRADRIVSLNTRVSVGPLKTPKPKKM